MTTITIPGFITCRKAERYEKSIASGPLAGMAVTWSEYDISNHGGRLAVCDFTLVFETPEGFDIREAQVVALQGKQKEAAAAFAALTTEINRQINELTAIEYTPEAIDALQTAAFAEGFDQAIEQGEAVAS